jgi:hypothetical protein
MKMKSFAMLATSGLLAGYIAYIAPAMADYTNASNPPVQQSTPADANGAAPSDQNAAVGATQNNPSVQNTAPAQNSAPNSPQDDQATPDTATGDDDY